MELLVYITGRGDMTVNPKDELIIDEVSTKLAPKRCPHCKKMALEEYSGRDFKCKKCKRVFRRVKVTLYKWIEVK